MLLRFSAFAGKGEENSGWAVGTRARTAGGSGKSPSLRRRREAEKLSRVCEVLGAVLRRSRGCKPGLGQVEELSWGQLAMGQDSKSTECDLPPLGATG